jgi:hypothetical protein
LPSASQYFAPLEPEHAAPAGFGTLPQALPEHVAVEQSFRGMHVSDDSRPALSQWLNVLPRQLLRLGLHS